MPDAAHGQLPATPPPRRTLGRFARLGLIGLIVLPFVLTEQLGLVASTAVDHRRGQRRCPDPVVLPRSELRDGVRLRPGSRRVTTSGHCSGSPCQACPGEVKTVQLRLFVRDSSNKGGVVHRVTGSWSESKVTWRTAPTFDRAALGRIGSTGRRGGWVTVPLRLTGLKAGQKVDLAIVGGSIERRLYASRETGKGPRARPDDRPRRALRRRTRPRLRIRRRRRTRPRHPIRTAHLPRRDARPDRDGPAQPTSTPAPTTAPTSAPPGGVRPRRSASSSAETELAALPTSGAAWTNVKSWADASAGTPDIQNQDEDNDIHVLAKALVYARNGDLQLPRRVLANLKAAVGSEAGGRTLAARPEPARLRHRRRPDRPGSYDPAFDSGVPSDRGCDAS